MTKQILYAIFLASGLSVFSCLGLEQARAQDSMDEVESLFSQEEQELSAPVSDDRGDSKQNEIKDVSDLEKLSEFKDIAVIQRRFLPRTGRFEFFAGGAAVLNDAFFLNFGFNGRLAYYFQERYGLELVANLLTTSEREVTTDLREKRRVTTKSLVTPKSYIGLDFKWTPVYGKMTWRNKKITPFDLYFSFGGGTTGTNQGASEPTLHLGTGQVFALSKSTAFRWDFSWNTYSAKSTESTSSGSSVYNNLLITLGMSFFFPEATYR